MSHDQDKVGYGKPPKQHQFKKGQSGNPSGLPSKGKQPTLKAVLEQVLNETVQVVQNGKPDKVTKLEAVVMSMVAQALKSPAGLKLLLAHMDKLGVGKQEERSFRINEAIVPMIEKIKASALLYNQPSADEAPPPQTAAPGDEDGAASDGDGGDAAGSAQSSSAPNDIIDSETWN